MKVRPRFPRMMLIGLVTLALGGELTSSRAGFDPNFYLGSVQNGSAQDLSGMYGVITVLNLNIGGGSTFSGTATESVSATADVISISGTITAGGVPGALVVRNLYENYVPPMGYEFVSYAGVLAGTPNVTNASFQGVAHSSTFSGPDAFASTTNISTLDSFTNFDMTGGSFGGAGTLTGTFSFTGPAGTEFALPASVGNMAGGSVVPEPSSICLTSFALGLAVAVRRIRSRIVPVSRNRG